jgi:hypothetical protein
MRRTQIYLTDAEAEVLGREARKTGRTRSQLIREAIGARYLGARTGSDVERALLETAGTWRGSGKREAGNAYVERIRTGKRIFELVERRQRR